MTAVEAPAAPVDAPRAERRRRLQVPATWWAPIAAAAAVQLWFRPGRFIAIGDVAPFTRIGLEREYPWFWNHATSGAGSTSYAIARAVEVWTIQVVEALGGSPMLAQRLFYTAIVALSIFAVSWCAAALVRHPWAVAAAGLVAFSNPFWIPRLPNPLIFVALGYVALVLGTMVRVARGERRSPIAFALLTLGCSYLAVNVALLGVLVAWSVACAVGAALLVDQGSPRRTLAFAGRAAPLALLVNLWWIAPMVWSLLAPAGFTISAELDAGAWSWTHVNNSIPKVATLTADWAWGYPEYVPIARTLDRLPFVVLRWALPAGAIAAVLLSRGERARPARALGALAIATILVSKGLHPPFSDVNRLAYDLVPGMSLLREPLSKLGPILVLSYALLLALLVEELVARAQAGSLRPKIAEAALVAGGGAILVAAFPMWTGQWVPTDQPIYPSARVEVPDWWDDAARAIDADPSTGRLLALPLNDYYQMPTTWGYYGVDQLSHRVERPVLQRLPGGYYTDAPELAALLGATETAVLNGDATAIAPLLDALGASLVVVRGDLDRQMVPDRRIEDPAQVAAGLQGVPGLELVGTFGPLELHRRTVDNGGADAFDRALAVEGSPGAGASAIASVRSDVAVLTAPDDLARARAAGLPIGDASVASRPMAGVTDLVVEPSDGVVLRRQATRTAIAQVEAGALSLRDAWTVSADAPAPELARLDLGGPSAEGVVVDGMASPLVEGRATIALDDGASVSPLSSSGDTPTLAGPGPVGTCGGAGGDTGAATAERRATPLPTGVRLTSSEGIACVSWQATIGRAPAGQWVRVDLEHRTVAGAPARLCVLADAERRCLPTASLGAGDGWVADAVIAPLPTGTERVRVVAYADAGDPDWGPPETVTEYRDLSLRVLEQGPVVRLDAPDPDPIATVDTRRPLIVRGPATGNVLGPFGPLGNCNRVDDRPAAQLDLGSDDVEDGIELRAGAHAACRWARIGQLSAATTFELSLTYETLAGRQRPRVCAFDPVTSRCLRIEAADGTGDPIDRLEAGPGPHDLRGRVVVPPGTSDLRLYLYADGPAASDPDEVTRVRYTSIEVVPVAPFDVVVAPIDALADPSASAPAAPPEVPTSWSGPARFEVELPAGGPWLLATHASAAPGWRLDDDGAEPATADGFRSAWILPSDGAARSAAGAYGPAILLRGIAVGSGLAALGLVGLMAGRRFRRGGRPPGTASAGSSPATRSR